MTKQTVDKKILTDVQVVEGAWRLIRSTNVKESLPPRHTLSDIWRASQQVQAVGMRFLDEYGERLEALDVTAWRELQSWKDSPI